MSIPVAINHVGVLTATAWTNSFGASPVDTSFAAVYA